MEEYLEQYGRHFNKRPFEAAVSAMRDRNGNPVTRLDKEKVDAFLDANGIKLKNNVGYDAAWVMHMKKADCWGSSIVNDAQLAMSVRDFLDDIDGYPTKAFDHYYTDCVGKGEPIFWDDVL